MTFTVLLLVALYNAVALSGRAQGRPTVTVCDLIRNPVKWESMHITIKGISTVTGFGDHVTFGSLVSNRDETCRYPDSPYSRSSEAAQIWLTYPQHFQPNPPGGSKLDQSSATRAFERLRQLQKRDPSLLRVTVTIDGFVLLRKYNLADNRQGTHPPIDPWSPVVLIVEAYKSVESGADRE